MKSFSKKIYLLLLLSFFLTACSSNNKNTINVGVLNNINSIGLINSTSSNEQIDGIDCNYITYDNTGDIAVDIAKGDLDIATLPIDLAAKIYNKKNQEIKLGAINTLGFLYLVENGSSVKSKKDLSDKSIYIIGKDNIYNTILNIYIENSHIENVTIVNVSDDDEIEKLLDEEGALALLPEPLATELSMNNSNIRKVFDMNDEWDSISIGNPLINSVLVIRRDFADNHSDLTNLFLDLCKRSVNDIHENIDEVASLIEDKKLLPVNTARGVLEDSHIVYIDNEELKFLTNDFLTHIYEYNSSLIGGDIPGDDFYYYK